MDRYLTSTLPLAAALAALLIPLAAARGDDQYRLPLLKAAPTMDGKCGPGEYDNAVALVIPSQRSAFALIGATETDLYVLISSEMPPNVPLLAEQDRDNERVVYDDAVEVFVDPDPAAEKGAEYQFLANSKAVRCYLANGRGEVEPAKKWDGKYEMANGVVDGRWIAEIRVPLSSIADGRKITEGVWGISACRDWKRPWVFSSTSPRFRSRQTRWQFVREGGLAVQEQDLADAFDRHIDKQLVIRNTGDKPVTVASTLKIGRNTMPDLTDAKTLTIAPGEQAVHRYTHTETNSTAFELSWSVATAGEGGAVHFARSYKWAQPRARRWEVTPVVKRPIDFQLAYFPYASKVRIRADVSGLPAEAKLDRVSLDLREVGRPQTTWGTSLVAGQFGADGICEVTLSVPELDGNYQMSMTAKGTNVPGDAVVQPLQRKRYVWERNDLGRSGMVYPPFLPIEVDGHTVKTILRTHELSDLGLPSAITAGLPDQAKPILAAPATLRVRIDGQDAPVNAQPIQLARVSDAEAETESSFTAGVLRAVAKGRWEYDGALKYDLTLSPAPGVTVDELTLEIALRADQATMIHAMGDYLRKTTSDFLPAGEGVIWDARKAYCGSLPEGFCSYIYLGNPHRGLSWFAQNDKGWGWDRKTPNLEVVRKGDVVTLRVHLINKPTKLDRPRTISFGLLAAPVKPRLPGWRYRWLTDRYNLYGTEINWLGGPGCCASYYPPEQDMEYWHAIARATKLHLPAEEIERINQRGLAMIRRLMDREGYVYYGAGNLAEANDAWTRHVRHNLGGGRYLCMPVFYYNRATWNAADEFPTFMNEWTCADYWPRTYVKSAGEIKVVPCESYNDFNLYWYAESFKHGGNRGVYWDNWFFNPTTNTAMSDAYFDAELGKIVPATGVWEMRELAKRTFTMMCDRGMTPIVFPHMTSTSPLPILSFATVQLDWEWNWENSYRRPYIQLVSNGELAGVWPVMLGAGGSPGRFMVPVCVVHELIAGRVGRRSAWTDLRDPLLPMMCNTETQVYRYWDERPQPVHADNPDVPCIVYSLPTHAMVVFANYTEKDQPVTITLDPAALGLKAPLRVVNYETDEPLEVIDGKVKATVKAYDGLGLTIKPAK